MEKSKLYQLLKTRWENSDLPTKTKNGLSVTYRQPATVIHTFHPRKPYPQDYCFSDTSCLHEFNKRPHDSMFIEDMKTLETKVSELRDSILVDLEKKHIPPGSVEHDDLLQTYCELIYTMNQLIDLEEKLVSFERRYLVQNIIENSIIGLLRCKNKLTQIEAFNVTYTIKKIIPLKIPVRKIQIDLPKFDSHHRAENIMSMITQVQLKLNMIENESFDNKESYTAIDSKDYNANNEGTTLIDLIKKSLKYRNAFDYNIDKALPNTQRRMGIKRLRRQLDESSTSLLEKLLYRCIQVKRSLFYKDLIIDLDDEIDFEKYYPVILSFYFAMDDPLKKPKLVKSVNLIKSHWCGYTDRHKLKPLKNTFHLFYDLMKSPSIWDTQNSYDKIQEEQAAYLKLYKTMYDLVTEFIKTNKKYEYARGTLVRVLDNWRKSINDRNELPIFIKNLYTKLVRTGLMTFDQKGFVEYRDVMDLIRIELWSTSYETNKKSKSNLPEYDNTMLAARIHEKIKNITRGKELRLLGALSLSEETVPNENEEINTNEEKVTADQNIEYYKDYFTKKSPAIKKELQKQKKMLEKCKKKKLIDKHKMRLYYHATPALSNVIDDVFIDLFVEAISNPGLEKNKKLDNSSEENGLNTDKPIEVIIEELIRNKIITKYRMTNFKDYFGTLSYNNERIILQELEKKKKFKEPLYTAQWLIQAVKEFCVLPLFSERTHKTAPLIKSVLLAGPPKCGKNMLVNAVCTHIGAVKFDLSAETIRESDFFENNDMETLKMYVLKAAKYLQPSILYVNDVHKTFLLSDPPQTPVNVDNILQILAANKEELHETQSEGTSENIESNRNLEEKLGHPTESQQAIPTLAEQTESFDASFLGDLLSHLASHITKDDMILIMGTSNKPFMSDVKLVEQVFNKILVFPRVDYRTARQYLSDKLLSNDRVDRNFNFHELATLCTGLPIPSMLSLIEHVSNKFLFDKVSSCCYGVPRLCKCSVMKTQLSMEEFIDILIPLRHHIVSQAHEELIFKWYESSKFDKMRPGVVKKWKDNIKKRNEISPKRISENILNLDESK